MEPLVIYYSYSVVYNYILVCLQNFSAICLHFSVVPIGSDDEGGQDEGSLNSNKFGSVRSLSDKYGHKQTPESISGTNLLICLQ